MNLLLVADATVPRFHRNTAPSPSSNPRAAPSIALPRGRGDLSARRGGLDDLRTCLQQLHRAELLNLLGERAVERGVRRACCRNSARFRSRSLRAFARDAVSSSSRYSVYARVRVDERRRNIGIAVLHGEREQVGVSARRDARAAEQLAGSDAADSRLLDRAPRDLRHACEGRVRRCEQSASVKTSAFVTPERRTEILSAQERLGRRGVRGRLSRQ